MTATLAYLFAASPSGRLLSVGIAPLVSFAARNEWVSALIGLGIGALLGAAFIEALLHSACSKACAFALDLRSSLAMGAGALLACFAQRWVADRVPSLHQRPEPSATIGEVSLIVLGSRLRLRARGTRTVVG